MNDDRSFEDVKRLHLQRPPIPESVVDDVKKVERLLEMGYISKEQAWKYLQGIEADLKKLQALVSSDKVEAIQTGEATEVSAIDYEKLKRWEDS